MKNVLILLSSLLLSCSHLSSKQGQFQLRPYEEVKLENGLTVLFIPNSSLPRLGIQLLLKKGAALDPQGKEGVSLLMTQMLEMGTTTRSAPKLAAELENLGSELNQSVTSDYITVSTSGLTQYEKELTSLFADVILNPAFEAKEITKKKSEQIASLQRMKDDPSSWTDVLTDRELFGSHPYGQVAAGTEKSVQELQRADVIRQYFRIFRPNEALLAVTGQYSAATRESLLQQFKKWQYRESDQLASAPEVKNQSQRVILFHQKGLQQTQIRMSRIGIQRTDPNFLKYRLANMTLGGAFASRLNQKVRDDKGLTYSIYSQVDARREPGLFEVSTFTRHEKVKETIETTLQALQEYRNEGMTSRELSAAKSVLIGQFPAALETTDRMAFNMMLLRLYGISDDYLKNFNQNVNSISKSQVHEAIQKLIVPSELQIVVYSDREAVEEQLKALAIPLTIKEAR